jgi:ABC-type transport system involved in cytochrome c biogenesis ATPase subunit
MHEAELLEREHELTALDALVEATQAGDGRLLVIEGPAGIGKTRLLSGLRRSSERPLRVLAARTRRSRARSSTTTPSVVCVRSRPRTTRRTCSSPTTP